MGNGLGVDLEAVVRAALEVLGIGGVEVSLLLVDPGEMARLNQRYRQVEGPTDTLSFPQIEAFGDPAEVDAQRIGTTLAALRRARPAGHPLHLGDVVLCPEVITEAAGRSGRPAAGELAEVALHGLLHLLGLDHGTPREAERMQALLRSILDEVAPGRVGP